MRRFLLGWLAGAISMILWRAHLDGPGPISEGGE